MKKIKKVLQVMFVLSLLIVAEGIAYADINLTIRDGDTKILEGTILLPPAGIISLNDSSGHPHDIDARSVLGLLSSIDQTNDDFEISEITDFGFSLYFKCITYSGGEKCDNWQYIVENSYPDVGMDTYPLSGTENVYVYFGPQNQVVLSSDSITTSETLTVIAQAYDYENNGWINRDGVPVGLTQPNPDDPFSPIEILTGTTDGNGQVTFSSVPVGSYDIGVKESSSFGDFYNSLEMESLTVATYAPSSSGSSGSSSKNKKKAEEKVLGAEIKISFDLKKAFDFLTAQQKEDGSFGESMYTDWTAMALASGNYQEQVIKLIKHFGEFKLENPRLTDYERRAMTLMALGLNPYSTNGENYIKKITASFDGKQFGDLHEDNDDIFALIVLQNAGYTQDEEIIKNAISFVISAQREDGSWDGSVDMTGASIEALAYFNQDEQVRPNDQEVGRVKNALAKAKDFLKQAQKDDGGWSNASSTAWAIEGIMALGEKPEDWIKSNNTPLDYLATLQDTDGGIKNENMQNKIWETAYVVSALSGKSWNQIMQKYEKPKDMGSVLGASTEIKTEVVPKKVITKIKKDTPKQPKIENTATVVNTVEENNIVPQPEPKKENWFIRFIKFIF